MNFELESSAGSAGHTCPFHNVPGVANQRVPTIATLILLKFESLLLRHTKE
jgi:hypothetical protein